jgi:hypothetical protein
VYLASGDRAVYSLVGNIILLRSPPKIIEMTVAWAAVWKMTTPHAVRSWTDKRDQYKVVNKMLECRAIASEGNL